MTTQATNNLKIIRTTKNFTQKEVAKHLQLQCEDRISHWERGSASPSLNNLLKLCELYGVTVEEVYTTREHL